MDEVLVFSETWDAQKVGDGEYSLNINDKDNSAFLKRIGANKTQTVLASTGETSYEPPPRLTRYELRAKLGKGRIDFEVFADNRLLFSATDSEPVLGRTSKTRFQMKVQPMPGKMQPGMAALIDNIRVTVRP